MKTKSFIPDRSLSFFSFFEEQVLEKIGLDTQEEIFGTISGTFYTISKQIF